MTLEEGRQELKRMIDATAEATIAGRELEARPEIPPQRCERLGAPADSFTVGYGLETDIARGAGLRSLVERVASFWRERGYDGVETENLETDVPTAYATPDGFNLSVTASGPRGKVFLEGGTPCCRIRRNPDDSPMLSIERGAREASLARKRGRDSALHGSAPMTQSGAALQRS